MYFSLSHKSLVAAFQNGSSLKDSYDVDLDTNITRDLKQFRDMIGHFSVVWNESEIYMLKDVVFCVIFENAVHDMTVLLLIDKSIIENNVTLVHTTSVPDWVRARVSWDTTGGAYVGTVFHEFSCSKTDSTVMLDVFRPGSQQNHLRSVSVLYIKPQPMKVQFLAICEEHNIAIFIIAIDNSTLVKSFYMAILDFGDGTDTFISDFRQDLATNLSHNIINNSGANWRITTVRHKYKWSGTYFAILKLPRCFEVYNLSTSINVYDSLYESVGNLDIILVGQETECCQESVDMTNTADIYADAIYLVCFEKIPPEEVFIFVDFGDSSAWSRIRLSINRTLDLLPLLPRRVFRYFKECHLAKTTHAFNMSGRYNVSVGILDRTGSIRERKILASTETIVRSFTDSVRDISLIISGDDDSGAIHVGQNVTFIIRLAHLVRNSVIAVKFSDQSPLTVTRISKETILSSSKKNLLYDVSVPVFYRFVRHGFYSVTVEIFDGSHINSSSLTVSTGVRVLSVGESVGSASLRVLETFPHIVNTDISFLLAVQRLIPTMTVMLSFGDGSYVSNVILSKSLDRYFGSNAEDCDGCFLAVVKHAYALTGNYSAIMTVKDGTENMNGVFSSVVIPLFITVKTFNAHLSDAYLLGRLQENGSVELQIRYSNDLPNLTVAFDFGDAYNTSQLHFLPTSERNLDTDTHEDGNIVARHTYSGTGPYRVLATIEDDAGAAFVLEKWIMVTPCSRPLVTVFCGGDSAQSVTVFSIHETVILKASYVSNCTYEHTVHAKWTLYRQSEGNVTDYLKYDSIINQETLLNITIPGFSLKPGNFMIHSEVILTDENGTILASNGTFAWFSIQNHLPAMKLVSNRYTYTLTDDVMLNVNITFTRKMITSDVIMYYYACFTTPDNKMISDSIWSISNSAANRTVSGQCFERGHEPFYRTTKPSLTFPAHLLRFRSLPRAFFFHVLALDPKTHVNTSASVRILLLKGPDPNITITCVQNCDSSVDPRSFIILSIGCFSCETETETDIKWEFLSESDNSPVRRLDEEYMRTEMNGRRLLVNGAVFANSTPDDVYRFTVQVRQRDGASASTWYSYHGPEAGNTGGNPMPAASSADEDHSGSKTSGLWFLWMLVLVLAVVAAIFLIKHYVIDRKQPERIAPTEEDAAQSDTATSDNRVDKDVSRRSVSSKYEQLTTDEQSPEELPPAANASEKEIPVRKEDSQTPLANVQELPLVVNVLDVLGNLRVPSPNSSTGSVKA